MAGKSFGFEDFQGKELFKVYTTIEDEEIKCRLSSESDESELSFEVLTYFMGIINRKSLIKYMEWLNKTFPCYITEYWKKKYQNLIYDTDFQTELNDVYKCKKYGGLILGKDMEVFKEENYTIILSTLQKTDRISDLEF